MIQLNTVEARVLGSLIEKEFTTPEYYPLTLNALVNACNQKNNRDPVVQFDEPIIEIALDNLMLRSLVYRVTGGEMRVPKYRQTFTSTLGLSQEEIAVITVLLLRGPQTPGEIKSRSGRLFEFADLNQVWDVMNRFMNRETDPYITKLKRQHGKDPRYMHLFCGEEISLEPEPDQPHKKEERVAVLENELDKMKHDLEELKTQFALFKKQFE